MQTTKRTLALSLVIALLQGGLLVSTARDKSDTADESAYLQGALYQWALGDFSANCHAPAIPRWGFGLGLRLEDPMLFREWRQDGPYKHHPLYSRPYDQMRRNLLAARLATVAITVLAGLALFFAAERLRTGAGLIAQILFAFSPSTLAHGSLATLDMWAAGWLSVSLFFLIRAERRPTFMGFGLLGLSLGLAAGSKLTVLPFLGLALPFSWWAARRAGASVVRSFLLSGLLLSAAALVIWASFGFRTGMVDLANLCGTGRGLGEGRFGPVLAPLWFEGSLLQVRRGQIGFFNYLLGETRRTGWLYFYVVVLAVKVTIGALVLAAACLFRRVRNGPGLPLRLEALLLVYPALLLVAMSVGNTQAGVRYLLPCFPFFTVWLAVESRRLIDGVPKGRVLVWMLVALGVVESVRIHPHHLMFFNLFAGGPEGGPRYLITSEDWGQDQRRLGEWQRANGVKRLYYSRYIGNPESWGITFRQALCEPRLAGKYALHATEVYRPKRVPPGCFDWLTQEAPDERIGYSIFIYRVDDARLERLKNGIQGPAFWSSPGLPPYRDRPKPGR